MKTILVDIIDTFLTKEEGIVAPIHDLLEEYPNRKILVTRAPEDLMKIWEMDNLPYEVWSSKGDPKKNDSEFYRKLLTHFRLNPNDVVYIEHNPDAVETAESVGILTHYYDRHERDIDALWDFLDANL